MVALVAKATSHGEAVDIGKHDVENDEIRLVLGRKLDGLGAIRGRKHLEARETKARGEKIANVWFIVDDEETRLVVLLLLRIHGSMV